MRFFKKVFNWISLVSFVAGLCLVAFGYLSNHSFLSYIKTLLADAQFGTSLKLVLCGIGLIILSLVFLSFSLRLGGRIKRMEKEKREEEKHQKDVENQLHQKIKEEAETAKAENERLRKEADDAKAELASIQRTMEQPAAQEENKM